MKIKGLVITTILIAAVGVGGYFGWQYLTDENASDTSMVYVTAVNSMKKTASGTQNRYAGVVEPQDTVEVKLENGRKVLKVDVEVGQVVKEGDILFEYDLTSIENELEEKQLEYDQLLNEAEGIKEQIITYTKEQQNAKQDQQLSYTIQIETAKMALKKNEYDQKSKAVELEKLRNSMGNTQVKAEKEGVVTKINTSQMESTDGSTYSDDSSMGMNTSGSSAFITILSTGAYRVKGKINEQNYRSISQGSPVIIRSRVDESFTWSGTMGTIDTENTKDSGSDSMYFYGSSDTQTTSSKYNFYVNLDNCDGLMLGQHVYIEMDYGQEETKDGLWLNEWYIVDAETEDPYVWGVHESGDTLEKIPVKLGEYDTFLFEYEILDGLTTDDYIAYPAMSMQEGMRTSVTDNLDLLIESSNDLDIAAYANDGYEESYQDIDGYDGDVFDDSFDDAMLESDLEGESWSEESWEDALDDSLGGISIDDLDMDALDDIMMETVEDIDAETVEGLAGEETEVG